ncbi:MAG: ABC transporter ATP-binding protein [Bacteroidales bacterium]
MKNSFLKVENLSIGYKSKKKTLVLYESLSFSLNRGEFVCLLGPNGAGKSTLLRTITGGQLSFDGRVIVNNQDLTFLSKKEIAKHFAVVLTDSVLVDNMSVLDLVAMGRYPYTDYWGNLKAEDWDIVEESIVLCGIEDLKYRHLNSLSDGERQKVMIAKALAQDTPLIILDEPTAFLDFPSKMEIIAILRDLTIHKNKIILMSTHDMELALQMSDKIWLLNKNYGFKQGTPEDLILQGKINLFFDKGNVGFNPLSGKFELKTTANRKINLQGGELQRKWLNSALAKINIKGVEGKDFPLISASQNNYLYYKDKESILFQTNSIEELISFIRTL